jgi:dihydroxyacid dehydratase/phosphogluconate dehydratase
MLHLRRLGLLALDCLTVTGERLGTLLDWWEGSERRRKLRERCSSWTASTPTT